MRRTTGATSGLIIFILGAWGALIPFVGPYFNYSYSPDSAWHWSTGRLWLNVLPGVVAMIGGLMLMGSIRRGSAGLGGWLALCAGVWFACGPAVSTLWNHGVPQTGVLLHSRVVRMLEQLGWHSALGVAIVALAGMAIGRLVPYRHAAIAADEGVVAAGPAGERRGGPEQRTTGERGAVADERRGDTDARAEEPTTVRDPDGNTTG
jgi:hypothetical protein